MLDAGGRYVVVWLVIVIGMVAPVLVGWCFWHFATFIGVAGSRWPERHRRRQQESDLVPLEQVVADLRRLADELARVERSDLPAKMARLRATALAYDGVLITACRTLEVPAPERPPLRPLERLETEAALAQHGLEW